MCLNRGHVKEKRKEILEKANGEGYKVFSEVDGKLRAPIYKGKTFGTGRWLNEKNYRAKGEKQDFLYYTDEKNSHLFYPTGWHIFLTLDVAIIFSKNYTDYHSIIKKVKFRKVVEVGLNDNSDCIVAKEILVMKDEVKLQENFYFITTRKR
jgi:hypothetical protein